MEAVAAGDDVALELAGLAVVDELDARPLALDVVHATASASKRSGRPAREPRLDQILDDLGLPVDEDARAHQLAERHVVPLSVELEVDAAVHDPLAVHPLADAGVAQKLGGGLLEHAGPDPVLDVLARARLENDRLDALAGEQLRRA